jgi:hypothetical protein
LAGDMLPNVKYCISMGMESPQGNGVLNEDKPSRSWILEASEAARCIGQ